MLPPEIVPTFVIAAVAPVPPNKFNVPFVLVIVPVAPVLPLFNVEVTDNLPLLVNVPLSAMVKVSTVKPLIEDAFNIVKFVNDRSLSEANRTTYGLNYRTYRDRMEQLVLVERARELCFEGKRWYDLMRYNYRHTANKADLTKKLSESYVTNSEQFLELALRKYAVPSAMKSKIRDERYLYMPINQDEVELNPNLVQNPVYKSSAKY